MLKDDPSSRDAWSGIGASLRAQKQHAAAAEAIVRSVEGSTDRHSAYVLYDAAAQYALAGRNDDALETLKRAFAAGYPRRDAIDKDPEFAALRADPRAKQLTSTR